MDEITDVFITAEDPRRLAEFTKRLVGDGLAACGNIIPGIRSIYTWEGKVEDGSEALVVLHTRKGMVQQIIDRTNNEHPGDTPQVLAVSMTEANPSYRDWLLTSTAERPG